MTDPKGVFTVENVVPLIYRAGVSPTIVATLNAVSTRLTQEGLLSMNVKIYDGTPYTTVARNWLKQVKLS